MEADRVGYPVSYGPVGIIFDDEDLRCRTKPGIDPAEERLLIRDIVQGVRHEYPIQRREVQVTGNEIRLYRDDVNAGTGSRFAGRGFDGSRFARDDPGLYEWFSVNRMDGGAIWKQAGKGPGEQAASASQVRPVGGDGGKIGIFDEGCGFVYIHGVPFLTGRSPLKLAFPDLLSIKNRISLLCALPGYPAVWRIVTVTGH